MCSVDLDTKTGSGSDSYSARFSILAISLSSLSTAKAIHLRVWTRRCEACSIGLLLPLGLCLVLALALLQRAFPKVPRLQARQEKRNETPSLRPRCKLRSCVQDIRSTSDPCSGWSSHRCSVKTSRKKKIDLRPLVRDCTKEGEREVGREPDVKCRERPDQAKPDRLSCLCVMPQRLIGVIRDYQPQRPWSSRQRKP